MKNDSLEPEIQKLKKKLNELKSRIKEKEETSKSKFDDVREFVKFYYRIDEFGKYQCIIALNDGTVFY